MRRVLFLTTLLLAVASLALAHDLFLKLDTYFLAPHTSVRVTAINGTFTKSEGYVTPDRQVGDTHTLDYESKWATLTFETR